ncbi:MAG TPA: DotU family type IV/VI secretion system protein [Pirellulales bacterium]|nr:DotU family type IV/VI secretion system protein [Pirellulales bacterium]
MTPKFSEAVDPIFLHVLRMLEQIDRGENPEAKEERQRIRGLFDQADAKLGNTADWQLAKYALVAWIDEVLIEAPWDGRNWWNENALEQEIFNGRRAFLQFYFKAKEASTLPRRDALEVFYVCAVLGFRGLYRDPVEAAAEAPSHELPADLESWARQISMAINLGQGLPPINETGQSADGAPALESKAFFVSYLLIGVILAGINLVVLAYFFRS